MEGVYAIRLSGEGGQGLVLAGIILAEAAALYEGRYAVQTQAYGPESRGGASKSEVLISDSEIDYPKASSVDLFLALTQEAVTRYGSQVKPGGIVVVDAERVRKLPEGAFVTHPVPIIEMAREWLEKPLVANIVALGVIAGLSKIVGRGALERAVLARVPKGTEALNQRALAAGFALAASPELPQGGAALVHAEERWVCEPPR